MYQIENLGFIAHPNTGSRSAREALEKLGAIKYGHHHGVDAEVIKRCEHVACTLRNPFDLMVSWYFRTQSGPGCMDFERWLPYILYSGVPRHYEGPGDKLFYGFEHCDLIIKFENLQADFNRVMDVCGLKRVGLGHVGQTKHRRPWQDMYTPPLVYMIKTEYGEQLEMGKYQCPVR